MIIINKITEEEKERQMALGYGMGKRPYSSTDNIIRWLDNGEIVEFTSPNFIGENVEFEINNNKNHKIWFSQLQGVFMNDKNKNEIFTGNIKLKDGTEELMLTLSSREFYELVKKRKFKVSVDNNAFLLIDGL